MKCAVKECNANSKVISSPIKSKLVGLFKPKLLYKKRTFAETLEEYDIPSN